MQNPLFDVGDILAPRLDDTGLIKCHVLEVRTQRCPAQIEQIQYICRIHSKTYKGTPANISTHLVFFNEIELVEYKEPEDKKN